MKCQDGLITLQLSDIIYIQVRNKLLILHTNKGEIQSSQRMRELEERLSRKLFFRCHNSYIVNFDYVEGLKNDSVLVKDKNQQLKEIPVSKYKKEEFMKELAIYVGIGRLNILCKKKSRFRHGMLIYRKKQSIVWTYLLILKGEKGYAGN